MINLLALRDASARFRLARPFEHCVVDEFFSPSIAWELAREFPDYNDPTLRLVSPLVVYDQPYQKKKALNDWNKFPPTTYRVVQELLSNEFVRFLSVNFAIQPLYPDYGLHGGGWHAHDNSGVLGPHLDYSLHPKLKLQRKLNLIIYLTEGFEERYGGQLALYSLPPHVKAKPYVEKAITPKFNRAVIFDTTQESWHGMLPLAMPDDMIRKSLAIYYLTSARGAAQRTKARFYDAE